MRLYCGYILISFAVIRRLPSSILLCCFGELRNMTDEYLNITAPVFNVQTYSIHDGPGIRVTVFLKGCPLRCLWCANPESKLSVPQLMTYGSKCTGCGACAAACPARAVTVALTDGKPTALTNRRLCANCGACVEDCPVNAREIAGKVQSVKEVLKKVQRDRMFLDASGGGMTVSGGEPLAHVDFTEALLWAAQEAGLHTAVESCSFGTREAVDRIYSHVNLALLDIKHMDSEIHRKLTGVPNELILENIKHIHNDLNIEAMISIPTIPGYNDSDKNIAETAKFIADEMGNDVRVRLLPYHRFGESKNESLGEEMNMSIEIPSDGHMKHLKELVESYGLDTQIGG